MPATAAAPTVTLQGIEQPASAVNNDLFFALTRRHRNIEDTKAFPGFGQTSFIELRKSDILSKLRVRFIGSLVITPGTGTVSTTMRWPYDLLSINFTANGQANLIACSGLKLKVRAAIADRNFTDRGVPQTVGAATVNQGTLSKSSESWGVGAGVTGLTAGTYDVELEWEVPIAEDDVQLAGSIFAQTSATDLTLNAAFRPQADLFTLTGNGAVALTGQLIVESEKFSIPVAGNQLVLPAGLAVFHSIIESGYSNQLGSGVLNELPLIGQGAGKSLLRAFRQVWAGAPSVPLAVNAANYTSQAWRYGSSETPESYLDGRSLRMLNEGDYGVDIGGVWGFLAHEFAVKNGFRDIVDMGQASELRDVIGIASGAPLVNNRVELVQEIVYPAAA